MSLDKSHYYFYSIYVFHNIFSIIGRETLDIPYFAVSQDFRNRLSALMMHNVFILVICDAGPALAHLAIVGGAPSCPRCGVGPSPACLC